MREGALGTPSRMKALNATSEDDREMLLLTRIPQAVITNAIITHLYPDYLLKFSRPTMIS